MASPFTVSIKLDCPSARTHGAVAFSGSLPCLLLFQPDPILLYDLSTQPFRFCMLPLPLPIGSSLAYRLTWSIPPTVQALCLDLDDLISGEKRGLLEHLSQAKDSGLDYIGDDELRPMVARKMQLLRKAESTQQSPPSSTIDSLNDQVPCDSDSRRLGYAENSTKALDDVNQSRQVQSIPNPRKRFSNVPESTRTDAQRNTWKKTKGIS